MIDLATLRRLQPSTLVSVAAGELADLIAERNALLDVLDGGDSRPALAAVSGEPYRVYVSGRGDREIGSQGRDAARHVPADQDSAGG